MTDKQTILATVEGLPEDASFPAIMATLQNLLMDVHTSAANQARSHVESVRPFGSCAGMFTVPDDFDDPLPADLQAMFEGRSEDE